LLVEGEARRKNLRRLLDELPGPKQGEARETTNIKKSGDDDREL
jgi:hypothetical protein